MEKDEEKMMIMMERKVEKEEKSDAQTEGSKEY